MSAQPVCRVGDPLSHGASVPSGSSDTTADGKAIVRVSDVYPCPIHGANPMSSGSAIFKDDGLGVCRVGDVASCGAVVTAGSPIWSSE